MQTKGSHDARARGQVRLAVERAKHRLVQRDRDGGTGLRKTRRLAKMKAKLKGQEEESEDEYADDDFEMPAGFDFGDGRERPGTTSKPKKRQDFGRPGTTVGQRDEVAMTCGATTASTPTRITGMVILIVMNMTSRAPSRARADAEPARDAPARADHRPRLLDRDYDTPYTVGRFPLKKEGPVPVSKAGEARHLVRRDDLKACDANGKPNLPLEIEVETQRHWRRVHDLVPG